MSTLYHSGALGEKLLCMLLHEMLHVFLEYYTCKCKKCEKRTARTGGPGKTNHGFAFCNAMIGLQEALQRVVGWKADCDLAHSVRAEMNASGGEPTEEQLKRWGLDHMILNFRRGKKPKTRAAHAGHSSSRERNGGRGSEDLNCTCCAIM
ncbi:hypothetical protein BKA64DRAFT_743581 [Cadophora sp. MPI-SDFR-AT-0126]|nr:hypothetical protein BKA64DRAFT_743581 [Leotiomycetes sp. MPI-SDFR-AT-0126]